MSLSLQEREQKFLATTARKVSYIKELAKDPENIKLALKTAGLPIALADEAETWNETLLIRREIRKALDTVGANALFVATKLKELADKGNVKAIELIGKWRGYNEPIPKSAQSHGGTLTADERELQRRRRITDLLNLPYYPIPEEAGPTQGDETQVGSTYQNPGGDRPEARLVDSNEEESGGEDSGIAGEEAPDAAGVPG